jgi:hypothetical protein
VPIYVNICIFYYYTRKSEVDESLHGEINYDRAGDRKIESNENVQRETPPTRDSEQA